ncbi:AsmA-like C-terminal domain-containing protein [Roseibium sp. RKSG952]|uniref:AsmA-like C-terminal domain-containing protein n=1 Tax=Roseibium sp. RKSG952 TaxID=2529384 RepID=UPI0012BB5C32|nr:AsmA-like C-terminal domain-containing protein [Roseibium sp. RKSG952]MTH96925.1 hypothetical protein [Roseibium sp. RKSG952]
MTAGTKKDKPGGKTSKVWLRRILLGLGGIFVLGLAVVVYLCATRPINVPYLAHFMATQASRDAATLTIANASLDFRDPDGIRVVVQDADLRVAGEVPVNIILPRVEAPVGIIDLFAGDITFKSLLIDRPQVTIGLPEGGGQVPGMAELTEAVNRVSDVVDASFARRKLEKVTISNGSVAFEGRLARRFDGIDAEIDRDDTNTLKADARIAGVTGPWQLEFLREVPANGGERRIGLLARGVTLAELMNAGTSPEPGKGLGLPFELKVDARLSANGMFAGTNIVARAVKGWLQMGRTTVRFDDAALSLLWAAGSDAIKVTRSHVVNGNSQLYFSGDITPPASGSDDWGIQLHTDFAQLGSSDIPLPPIRIEEITFNGRANLKNRSLLIDRLALRNGSAEAYGSGSLDIKPDGPYLAFVLDGKAIPMPLAKQAWPITLVPPARKWIIEHIEAGTINTARVSAAVRPPAFDRSDPDPGWSGNDVTANVTFSNGQVAPIGDVPAVSGLNGTLTVANETLTAEAQNALIKMTGNQNIDVPSVAFKILHLPLRTGKIGDLNVDMKGTVADLGDVINSAPFRILDRAGLGGEEPSGSADLKVTAEFPLDNDIQMDQVKWNAIAVSKDFSAEKPIYGQLIKDADVTLTADPTNVTIKGKGLLNGLSADIDIVMPLNNSDVAARQGVVVTATTAQLKQRGVDLTSFVDGSLVMTVNETDEGQSFSINLTSALLKLDALGWQKAKGVPATATFALTETDGEKLISGFKLVSDGVDLSGRLTISDKGELLNASFSTFQLRAGDTASVTIQKSGRQYKVAMVGSNFDARGLIRRAGRPGGGASGKDFAGGVSISVNLATVVGFEGRRLNNLKGTIDVGPAGLETVDLNATIDGRAPLSFRLSPAGSGKYAHGDFADTGALLRFLDLYKRMRGGKGQLAITMSTNTAWDGSFIVKGFSLFDDPAIEKLGQGVRLTERGESSRVVSNTAASSGQASFDTLDISFTRDGDVLNLTKGALKGAVIGGTVSGKVNLESQQLDLTGTFVPIYAINNLFAKIPIIGWALGGGRSEGLLGVTYKLAGPIADPKFSVNPISAIAPGIFRKMFEFH